MHTINGTTYGSAGDAIAALAPGYANLAGTQRDELRFDLAVRIAGTAQAGLLALAPDGSVQDEAVGVLLAPKDEMAPTHAMPNLGVRLVVTDLPYIAGGVTPPADALVIKAVDEVAFLESLQLAGLLEYSAT